EEPPGDVVFVLVTESPEDLLPTVVSRCRRVDFFPLGPAEIERVLVTQHDAEPSLASWAARTGGDLSTALRFVKDPGAPERRRAPTQRGSSARSSGSKTRGELSRATCRPSWRSKRSSWSSARLAPAQEPGRRTTAPQRRTLRHDEERVPRPGRARARSDADAHPRRLPTSRGRADRFAGARPAVRGRRSHRPGRRRRPRLLLHHRRSRPRVPRRP